MKIVIEMLWPVVASIFCNAIHQHQGVGWQGRILLEIEKLLTQSSGFNNITCKAKETHNILMLKRYLFYNFKQLKVLTIIFAIFLTTVS